MGGPRTARAEGPGRIKTVNTTDFGIDLDALPDRRPDAHLELLKSEVRAGWAERRRVERRVGGAAAIRTSGHGASVAL